MPRPPQPAAPCTPWGPVGQGAPRPRAAKGEDAVAPCQLRRREHDLRRKPRLSGWGGAQHDLADAGHTCRYDAHQNTARVCGSSAGRVHANTPERVGPAADDHAGFTFRLLAHRAKRTMYALDVLGGSLDRATP